jgi:hypothetical protein
MFCCFRNNCRCLSERQVQFQPVIRTCDSSKLQTVGAVREFKQSQRLRTGKDTSPRACELITGRHTDRALWKHLTDYMEQSPSSEADSSSTSQEIHLFLQKPKVHYRIPILCQMNPDRNFPPYFPKINSNIIFPYTSMPLPPCSILLPYNKYF